jgi:three-Cys-motif partner protein
MGNENFFESARPAAVLKHGILRRYVRPFVQKVGSTSKGRRVAYIDGYAGPGVYDDGAPGSPAVAVEIAKEIVDAAGTSRIDGYFVEREADSAEALRDLFLKYQMPWPVFRGNVHEHLPKIVQTIHADTALFAFLDPFGLGIPLDMIDGQLLSRSGKLRYGYRVDGAATEVLLNFSFPGLRRRGGHLVSKKKNATYLKARATMIDNMDATLGGDWWHEIWRSDAEDRCELILDGYMERIVKLDGGWKVYGVDVANGIDKKPIYYMLLLTQHPDGVWLFNNAVSSSVEDWRTTCFDLSGQMDLYPLTDREAEWVDEIKRAVEKRLTKGTFMLGANVPETYGDAFGLAREKHLRKALKELNAEGVIENDGRGSLQKLWVRPPKL